MTHKAKFSVPKGEIRWLVGRIHVGTPEATVRADIRERLQRAKREGNITEAQILACEDYAIECHKANRDEYSFVMGGH